MKGLSHPLLFLTFILLSTTLDERGGPSRGLASSWNMIPSRSLAGLHYIFKGYEFDEDQTSVKVSGPVVEVTGGGKSPSQIHEEGFQSEMDPEDFEEEQALALSVFEATSGKGTSVGTAFLVGREVVLTNRHILDVRPMDKKWPCGRFSIKLNHLEERVTCEKVLFCSSAYDYCVVKMNALANERALGDEIKPLRLTKSIKEHPDVSLLHIGNAGGLGLQASRGKGLIVKGGEFFHYVPTLLGSSGAPLFNERYEVIGLNWGHTGNDYVGESAYNRGVLVKAIFEELKLRPEVLHEIRSFRSWLRREQKHHQVKIAD